jgi:predicted ATPase/DNA-binding CsgD family transcriptional regulator/DNA-binding XRE family transcriptional regulator
VAGAQSEEGDRFGEVLRRYRVAAGLTQEALAERAGLSPRGISDLERATRTHPYPATAHRLAAALGLAEADRRMLETAAEPPARSGPGKSSPLPAHIGMLPAPLSRFIGREHEVAEVRRVLAAYRLVTLIGPGGIGKTRLAVEAATRIGAQFVDGVVFVALASVRDPDLVVGAVAQALSIQEMGSRALADRVHTQLRNADLLLLLDNFEHVLPAAESVAFLLADCPRLRVLVTSRAPLRISGEREVAVHPLALPNPRNLPPPEQLRNYEAVQLFVERGASACPDLARTGEQAGVVAEICARLDGLPLAIELAAARLRVLSPEMLLARLEHRLPPLVGGPRDAPARQQTLTATISWSYDLLGPDEQRLFRRLSVFVGGRHTRRIHEALGDRWGLSYTLRYLAVTLWMEADYAAARPVIEAALALAGEIGDRQGAATTLTVPSFVSRSLGENAAAEAAASEALALHQSYGDRRGGAQALWALGMALAGQGRYGEASAPYKRALGVFAEIGDRYFTSMCLIGLAEIALAAGRPRDAVVLPAAGSAMMAVMGAPLWPSIRPYIGQTLDQARATLGEADFEPAWAKGESLSVEQAVALAMVVPEPPWPIDRPSVLAHGASQLTPRELAVARRIARGLTNKQIAADLFIAEGTADRHVANILGKLGFRSRAQVAAWVIEHAAETRASPAASRI